MYRHGKSCWMKILNICMMIYKLIVYQCTWFNTTNMMIFIRFFFTTVRYSLSYVPIWYTSVSLIYLFAQSLFTIIIIHLCTGIPFFLLQTCKMFAIIMFMYIEIYFFFFFNSLFLHGLIFIHIFYTVDNVYYFSIKLNSLLLQLLCI